MGYNTVAFGIVAVGLVAAGLALCLPRPRPALDEPVSGASGYSSTSRTSPVR